MDSPHTTFTVAELAQRLGGLVRGGSAGGAATRITGINSIREAGPGDITFIADDYHLKLWRDSKATAAVISKSLENDCQADSRCVIFVNDAEIASIGLLDLFQRPAPQPAIGVHPSAVVHPSAKLGKNARIGPHVSIDEMAVIGDGVVLHAGVRIYAGVTIGEACELHANCVVRHNCTIGRRVILHQNVSIGADGFGYRPSPDFKSLLKVQHIGTVIIEDDVEIGANSCVDRGKFGATFIGAGTKIDNLVQIAHNCRIGKMCLLAGLAGLSGSVEIGDGVQIGGQVGIADHVKVGSGAKIGAQSGVIGDLPGGGVYIGAPAQPRLEALRQAAAQRKLPDLIRRLSRQSPPPDESTG